MRLMSKLLNTAGHFDTALNIDKKDGCRVGMSHYNQIHRQGLIFKMLMDLMIFRNTR